MAIENPTPNNMPRKRKPQSKRESPLTEDGWLKGKAHTRAAEAISCGCFIMHETIGLTEIFNAGVTTPKAIFNLYDRYADVSQKVHNSNREANWKTVTQEAEEILLFEGK